MGTPKLLCSTFLRRRLLPRQPPPACFSSTTVPQYLHHHHHHHRHHHHCTIAFHSNNHSFHSPPSLSNNFLFSRAFSSRNSPFGEVGHDLASTQYHLSEGLVSEQGDISGLNIAEAAATVSSGGGEESNFPVRSLISLLDGYHDLTGLPWWIVIASSTVALRIALLPVFFLQLTKLKKVAELLPKLPPPLPPPLSGRSYAGQFSLFWEQKRAVGCPSFLWFLASVSVQFPCFSLWMTSIRRMALDHHPGFGCGGTLWFQNLTEYADGVLSLIFPVLIAGMHFMNVQISFWDSSVGEGTGLLSLLVKWYRRYLELLSLPIFLSGFFIPQGSLVYWVTNSSLSIIQQLSLRHPDVREFLGLPDKDALATATKTKEADTCKVASLDLPKKQQRISVHELSPQELVVLSIKHLAEGHKDRAIPLLRLALDKDPKCVKALVVMGQTLLQQQQLAESAEYLERAIFEILLMEHPTSVEDVDNLILASQWAGVACIKQGKKAEGIAHLDRITHLEEPKDSKSKAHYYDALVLLASALYDEDRKVEAFKYLRMAAAYDPAYGVFLEQYGIEDNFVLDLESSRRGDY